MISGSVHCERGRIDLSLYRNARGEDGISNRTANHVLLIERTRELRQLLPFVCSSMRLRDAT